MGEVTDDLTQMQMLAMARDFVGRVIYLKPFEKVIKVSIDGEVIKVLFETYAWTETQTRVKFTKKGKRLWTWDRATHTPDQMVVWDDTYAGEEIALYGRVATPTEAAEQVAYERACHRPGTGRAPLDNYARTRAGATTDRMTNHW